MPEEIHGPTARKYAGELWIDESGEANFRFHVSGGSFLDAKAALQKFRDLIQWRLDNAAACPFYQSDKEAPTMPEEVFSVKDRSDIAARVQPCEEDCQTRAVCNLRECVAVCECASPCNRTPRPENCRMRSLITISPRGSA